MSHVDSKDEAMEKILNPPRKANDSKESKKEEEKKDGIDWEENTEEDPDIEW